MRQSIAALVLAVALTFSPLGVLSAYAEPAAGTGTDAASTQDGTSGSSSGTSSARTSKSSGATLNSADTAAGGNAGGASGGGADAATNTPAQTKPKKNIKVPPAYDPDAWDAASLDARDPDYPYPVEMTQRAESDDTYSIELAPTKPPLTKIRMGFYDTPQDAVNIPNNTLLIKGTQIPYVDWRSHDDAPDHNGGLWEGAESPIDGHWGYFIGHNPGDFTPVYHLVKGDVVYVKDSNGVLGCYTVTKIKEVNYGSVLGDLRYDIEPLGEAVVFQTCINGGAQLRVVIAEAPRPYVYQS